MQTSQISRCLVLEQRLSLVDWALWLDQFKSRSQGWQISYWIKTKRQVCKINWHMPCIVDFKTQSIRLKEISSKREKASIKIALWSMAVKWGHTRFKSLQASTVSEKLEIQSYLSKSLLVANRWALARPPNIIISQMTHHGPLFRSTRRP